MSPDQPSLFDPTPPRDPVRCPRCGWHGDGGELVMVADEYGEAESCPGCGEETIMEG